MSDMPDMQDSSDLSMSDAFTGEIRIFAGNFAPKRWAFCNGQLMSVSENSTLYSILGFKYGGDGKTTFALPNFIGRAPMHQGNGQGLTPRTVGETVGSPTVTLLTTEIPNHTHTPHAINDSGNKTEPTNNYWAKGPDAGPFSPPPNLFDPTPDVQMSPVALNVTGESQPHNNMQPYIAQNFIICLDGQFPQKG